MSRDEIHPAAGNEAMPLWTTHLVPSTHFHMGHPCHYLASSKFLEIEIPHFVKNRVRLLLLHKKASHNLGEQLNMRFIQLILSCLCLLKLANAHGDGGVIEAFGMGKLGHNLARSAGIFDGPERYFERDVGERVRPWPLSERAANMRCGYVNGTCPTGYW
jgi:hypothetical protein